MSTVKTTARLLVAALLGVLLIAPPAFAYDEVNTPASTDCALCHGTPAVASKGPHGNYTATSSRCGACHKVHVAATGGVKLLPEATIRGTCETCHDGTGGNGVYGVLTARGVPVLADHSIDTTNVIPGGSESDGGDAVADFSGTDDKLTCSDCHSPHDSSTIDPFTGDRARATLNPVVSNRLLRRQPVGSALSNPKYGSDWCGGCHLGRRSGVSGAHNHPVDSTATAGAGTYYYENVAKLDADTPTGVTVMGTMGRTNRGFLMPFPRTAQQAGHKPICQQCHEDARNVGTLGTPGSTADAEPFSVTATDGAAPADNPRFQTFPHESQNLSFLVETDDDLCVNCHDPEVQLP